MRFFCFASSVMDICDVLSTLDFDTQMLGGIIFDNGDIRVRARDNFEGLSLFVLYD